MFIIKPFKCLKSHLSVLTSTTSNLNYPKLILTSYIYQDSCNGYEVGLCYAEYWSKICYGSRPGNSRRLSRGKQSHFLDYGNMVTAPEKTGNVNSRIEILNIELSTLTWTVWHKLDIQFHVNISIIEGLMVTFTNAITINDLWTYSSQEWIWFEVIQLQSYIDSHYIFEHARLNSMSLEIFQSGLLWNNMLIMGLRNFLVYSCHLWFLLLHQKPCSKLNNENLTIIMKYLKE